MTLHGESESLGVVKDGTTEIAALLAAEQELRFCFMAFIFVLLAVLRVVGLRMRG